MHRSLPDVDFHSGHADLYRYWPDLPRPDGDATQWLEFRLRLHDFVAHTPASHFAIVLGASLAFDAHGRPVSISGRGMTFGDTSQAQPAQDNPHAHAGGFGGARGAQAESFWPGGNFLYAGSALLADGVEDERWYAIRLQLDAARGIALSVTPEGAATEHAAVQDRIAHPVPAACGVLIGIGRGGNERGPWRAELRDLATGWTFEPRLARSVA